MSTTAIPEGPPPELRYRRRIGVRRVLIELWQARELTYTIAERDLRARYKQASLGIAWALITPFALMLVFTLVFQRAAAVDTGGVPYPLFAYVGLLPWTFFSSSLSQGGMSLVLNQGIINKVYCPREVFPMASMLVAGVDVGVATIPLGLLFIFHGYAPKATSVWIPLLASVEIAFTLGVTLLIAAFLVYMRDLRHLLPIALQVGLFATPVAYGIDIIPRSFQPLYCALNPLAPVIDGLRRVVLLGLPPDWSLLLPGAVMSIVWLVLGYAAFKHLETGFADVA